MKIMLISSIVTNSALSNPEWTAEFDVGDFPPIGLMYIAGYLRKYSPQHEVKILDANLLRYTQEDIKKEIVEYKPDVVGMTVYTDILYDCVETLKIVKDISKDIYVVVGGSHPNYHVDETMEIPQVDCICLGEGEIVFAELTDALDGKRDKSTVKGIVYRNNSGNVLRNNDVGYIDNLDSLPHPAFDLVPFKSYYSMIGTGVPIGVLCSSRGCPYKCTFCSKFYDSYRGRSPENVIDEMKLYHERGIREFLFFDDMFNLSPNRAMKIANAIEINFKNIEWSFRGRADQITEELATALRKSRCTQVTLGAEAHTDEIQKELKTGKKIESIRDAVRILRKNKIKVNTNWIIGLPQHKSPKDIEEMMQMVFKIDPDYVQFSILMLWEDTALFRDAAERKIVDPEIWKEYIKKPDPKFLIPAWEEHLSLGEQSKLVRNCYSKFYFRPKIILRQIMSVKNWRTFKIKLKGFFLMLIPIFYPIIRIFKPDLSGRKNNYKMT